MIRELPPYAERQIKQLSTIYEAANNISFSKNEAMKIVGSRGALEMLVETKKIRMTQTGKKWFCNAADVLRHVNYNKTQA
ncbi:hypothetical protein [Phocaeicola sp.]